MSKTSNEKETIFNVVAPPGSGYYKLVIHAARVPRVKAKVIMPVVATFLVCIFFLVKQHFNNEYYIESF